MTMRVLAASLLLDLHRDNKPFYNLLFECASCAGAVSARAIKSLPVSNTARRQLEEFGSQLPKVDGLLSDLGWRILKIWPEPPAPRIPMHLPPEAAKAFASAEDNFPREGNEEAAAVMYRRAVERAFAHRFGASKDNLKKRIEALVKSGDMSKDLGEWAHEVRAIGNDGAHDAEVTREELIALRAFADAVLRYAISLPAEIAARRAATQPPAAGPSE